MIARTFTHLYLYVHLYNTLSLCDIEQQCWYESFVTVMLTVCLNKYIYIWISVNFVIYLLFLLSLVPANEMHDTKRLGGILINVPYR